MLLHVQKVVAVKFNGVIYIPHLEGHITITQSAILHGSLVGKILFHGMVMERYTWVEVKVRLRGIAVVNHSGHNQPQ